MGWIAFEAGETVGKQGSEGGLILRDEEHLEGARITLEQGGQVAPFAMTCGLSGWMVHTRFFTSQQQTEAAFEEMKEPLAALFASMVSQAGEDEDDTMDRVGALISEFVERFP